MSLSNKEGAISEKHFSKVHEKWNISVLQKPMWMDISCNSYSLTIYKLLKLVSGEENKLIDTKFLKCIW